MLEVVQALSGQRARVWEEVRCRAGRPGSERAQASPGEAEGGAGLDR